jgi:hypothetical protein
MELKDKDRYVPDYPDSKAAYYHIYHESNLKISMKASEVFNQMAINWSHDERVNDLRLK